MALFLGSMFPIAVVADSSWSSIIWGYLHARFVFPREWMLIHRLVDMGSQLSLRAMDGASTALMGKVQETTSALFFAR